MIEKVQLYFKRTKEKLWGGRKSRASFLLGVAFHAALTVAVWMPAEMVQFIAPQLLWELYGVVLVAVALCSLVGICRLYVQRLHDMGLVGYWAIAALAAGPMALLLLAEKYSSWRGSLDNDFPSGVWMDAVIYSILGAVLFIALFKGSEDENRYGPKPEVLGLPQNDRQMKWSAISIACFGVPFFAYLGFFNDGVWARRADHLPASTTSVNASGQRFMYCWGFDGISAYWNAPDNDEDYIGQFRDGFTRDGYADTVFGFFVAEDGSIDVAAGGPDPGSYRSDGFTVTLHNPNNLDLRDYEWSESEAAAAFMVVASYTEEASAAQTEYIFSFARIDEYGSYRAIATKNYINPDSLMIAPYIKGEVMIGNCLAS